MHYITLNQTIDLEVIVAETLEIIFNSDKPYYYVDRNQQWYNAVIKLDAQLADDDILKETIQLPLWKRMYRTLFKSYALSIPVYADKAFTIRKNDITLDKFINGCTITATENADSWGRLVWGDASISDYLLYFNNSINS